MRLLPPVTPFQMLVDPGAVFDAIAASGRLASLQRRVFRPMGDFGAGDEGAEEWFEAPGDADASGQGSGQGSGDRTGQGPRHGGRNELGDGLHDGLRDGFVAGSRVDFDATLEGGPEDPLPTR